MRKKRKSATRQQGVKKEDFALTLSDSIDDDVLAKLKEAKKQLTTVAEESEKKRQEQIRLERKKREDNKSFEELLEEYGNLELKN